jgi:YgiT-type zinc finger domain-containing protein
MNQRVTDLLPFYKNMKLKQYDNCVVCEDITEPKLETHILPFLGRRYEIKDIKTQTCKKCGEKFFAGRQILEAEKRIKNGEIKPIN